MSRLGTYITINTAGERYQAFMPPALPPEPPIDLKELQPLIVKATKAMGRLDGVADVLPYSSLFLYYYVRKEAVLSSQIEGTQSSLSDLLIYESEDQAGVPIDDVVEVSRYVAAFEHGLKRIQEGFPLSLRLIREMHEKLLTDARGANKQPGEFRRTQNWIGGSRPGNAHFVPPEPERLMECLDALEKYLHIEERPYSSLIDAGLIHVQFETIHPFLDGNGRIGRLLITFFLMLMGEMKQPWLYLSLFFKNNRSEYYRRLDAVRQSGDWEGWLDFFLQGVAETAEQVVMTSRNIAALFEEDRRRIHTLKRAAINARKLHDVLCKHAIISANDAAKALELTPQTTRSLLKQLGELGIVIDVKGKRKERLYIYKQLIQLLEEGSEPIAYS